MLDKKRSAASSRLLSRQVSGARYFFLNLAPRRGERLVVAFGGAEVCNPDYAVDRRHFSFFGLEYVAEGAGLAILDGIGHGLEPGSVFAYGPRTHVEIRTDARRPMLKYFICFRGTDSAASLAACGLGQGWTRTLSAHAGIRSVFEDLIIEGQHHGPLAREVGATLFRLLLLKLRGAAGRSPRRGSRKQARDTFLRCKAVIDANVGGLGSLREVAAEAGVEVSNISRLFRRYQGTSPYQYLLRRKMTLAAARLVEHGDLVKEAALEVGFADPYHFSRCFKAVHGVAPRDFLRYTGSRR